MSKQLFLFILLFISLNSHEQSTPSEPDLGEGIITIRQYGFSADDTVFSNSSLMGKDQNFYEFVYYIKGRLILRHDLKIKDSEIMELRDSVGAEHEIHTTLNVSIQHPNYLIDWEKKVAYAFYQRRGQPQISQMPLQNDSTEIFYRLMADNKATKVSFPNDRHSESILNRKCLEGTVTVNGEEIVFYYTTDSLKVCSPLNGFVPPDFPYQVLRVQLGGIRTAFDGKTSKGVMVFQVADIKDCKLQDALFRLPADAQIHKNVPLKEMYFPESTQ